MFFYNLEIKMKTEEQTKYYNTPGEVLKKIKSRIYDLSVSYDSNEYMRVKDNFIAFINEMNENFKILKNEPSKSNFNDDENCVQKYQPYTKKEIKHYKKNVFHLIHFIQNFDDIFLNTTTHSELITLSLLISLSKSEFFYNSIDDFLFLISLYNKILNIIKTFPYKEVLGSEYEREIEFAVSKLSSLNLPSAENVMNRYINYHTEIVEKNKKENFIMNESSIDDSSIMIDGVALREKEMKDALNDPSKLIQFYKELERDSNLIDQMIERNESCLFQNISNINTQYLILFSKIVDKLSQSSIKYIKELFLNKIFRSKIFIEYMQQNIVVNFDMALCKNRQIYIEKYANIGNFIYKTINIRTNIDFFQKMNSITDKYLSKLDIIFNHFKNKESPPIELDRSMSSFHSFLYCVMKRTIFHNSFNFLAINIKFSFEDISKSEMYFESLQKHFENYEVITNIRTESPAHIVDFKTGKLKANPKRHQFFFLFDIGGCSFLIENNTGEIQRREILANVIFANPLYIFLFISLRMWAINRNLFIDYNCSDKKRFFDDGLLLFFIYYYLINIGKADVVNRAKVANEKEKMKIALKNNNINTSCNLGELGKLYVDFFYFMLCLMHSAKEAQEQNQILEISLTSYKFNKNNASDKKYNVFKAQAAIENRKIALVLSDYLNKDVLLYRYDTKQVKNLSKELTRMLHILLNENKYYQIFTILKEYEQ